ncbi:hypothetical protein BDR22DRAFT_718450 [Usnea florida]
MPSSLHLVTQLSQSSYLSSPIDSLFSPVIVFPKKYNSRYAEPPFTWHHRPKMSRVLDALDLFFDDPSFAILLWAVPALFKATILMEYEDAIILTALTMVAVVLGVLVLNRTLFLMMMMMMVVAASTFGIGSLVVGIWVVGIWALMVGYVATARELAHGEVC